MRSSVAEAFVNYSSAYTVLLGFLLASLAIVSQACSPMKNPPPDTLERRVHFANVVIHGKVLRHYNHPLLPQISNHSRVFSAEMEIFCVYKGGPIARIINITKAGTVPGMCFSTQFALNGTFVVFLRDETNPNGPPGQQRELQPDSSELAVEGFIDEILRNLSRVCDLNIDYPTGPISQPRKYECPAPLSDPDCNRFDPPTYMPPLSPQTTKPFKDHSTPGPKVDEQGQQKKEEDYPPGSADAKVTNMLEITAALVLVWTMVR